MSSLLKNTKNARALLPGSLRFIRSDALTNLCEEDIAWLRENNILTAVDLRSPDETKLRPCSLSGVDGFTYLSLPVTGGNIFPASPDEVPDSYIRMVDSMMERIVKTILNAETNVIFFCHAGKDRTGVVSAIIEKHFGVENTAIISDYALSAGNLTELIEHFALTHPEVKYDIMTPKPEYMEKFLALYEKAPLAL